MSVDDRSMSPRTWRMQMFAVAGSATLLALSMVLVVMPYGHGIPVSLPKGPPGLGYGAVCGPAVSNVAAAGSGYTYAPDGRLLSAGWGDYLAGETCVKTARQRVVGGVVAFAAAVMLSVVVARRLRRRVTSLLAAAAACAAGCVLVFGLIAAMRTTSTTVFVAAPGGDAPVVVAKRCRSAVAPSGDPSCYVAREHWKEHWGHLTLAGGAVLVVSGVWFVTTRRRRIPPSSALAIAAAS